MRENEKIYIGRKGDRLDELLASSINSFPEKNKMKILFLRESEGVYQFGSKKVYLKVGKND